MDTAHDDAPRAAGDPREDEAEAYLAPTFYLDFDDPRVAAFARDRAGETGSDLERTVRLYYAVRDEIHYDPYSMEISPRVMTASHCLETGRGFCVPKAALLAACARCVGVPARLGYADVRNHLATARLLERLGTDLFIYHGYVELRLEGSWVKATPAFNIGLCEKFRVLPLEFDGRADSLFHPFDADGKQHMEYVNDRGAYADLPFAEMERAFRATYPNFLGADGKARFGDFEKEAAAESAG